MNIVCYRGGSLDRTADFIVAGDGIFTTKRVFGRCVPHLVIACELRGVPPLLARSPGGQTPDLATLPLAPTFHVLRHQWPLPAFDARHLFQYVIARNGVFLLAKSTDVELCLPLCEVDLPGLVTCAPFVRFLHPRVPAYIVEEVFADARAACQSSGGSRERLWYLLKTHGTWQVHIPEQEASEWSVQARAPTPESFAAILEGHSHHRATASFSEGDDEAELVHGGFRLFFVLGHIFGHTPEILVRVCVHGYAWLIPAALCFEIPPGIVDAYWTASGEGAWP